MKANSKEAFCLREAVKNVAAPKDIITCVNNFLTLRFEGYNIEKNSHAHIYLIFLTGKRYLLFQYILQTIAGWAGFFLKNSFFPPKKHIFLLSRHTDMASQVERHYLSYWSNSDEAGSPNPTWINPFISYQRLWEGGQETLFDFTHRVLSGYKGIILHQS